MTYPSTNPATQGQLGQSRKGNTKSSLTPEQVQAITDRVYAMLLRDLKQERERHRTFVWNSGTFKRG
jgi:hypothetical protein